MTPIEHDSPAPRVTGLSRWQFIGCLALAVAIFLVSAGPIWRDPWAMDSVNEAILWSYAPVPLLVLGCLAASRRLRWRWFFFDTMRLTFAKYSITFGIALVLWTMNDGPANAATATAPHRSATPGATTAASVPAGPTGSVRGHVVAADGTPAADVLVFVDPDLAVAQTGAALQPVQLEHDLRGLTPRLAAVQVGQSMAIRSTDGRMHTVVAETAEGAPLFNVPAIRSGAWSTVTVREPHHRVTLRCTVHPRDAEPEAELVVLRHSLWSRTDAAGQFAIAGVPTGRHELHARTLDAPSTITSVVLEAGETAEVRIALPGVVASAHAQ
jgi:hypothetical protein